MRAFHDKNTAKKVSHIYQSGKEELANVMHQAKDSSEDLGRKFKKKAATWYKKGKHQVDALEETVSDYSGELFQVIRKKPFTSLLIAGTIGYLIAKLLNK